jgi:hypothetical protein
MHDVRVCCVGGWVSYSEVTCFIAFKEVTLTKREFACHPYTISSSKSIQSQVLN